MTEAMPFLQKTILLSYDPRSLPGGLFIFGQSPALTAVRPSAYGCGERSVCPAPDVAAMAADYFSFFEKNVTILCLRTVLRTNL